MEDKNKDFELPEENFLAEEPPLEEEFVDITPEFKLAPEGSPASQETVIIPDMEDVVLEQEPIWPNAQALAPQPEQPAAPIVDETTVFPIPENTGETFQDMSLPPLFDGELQADEFDIAAHELTYPIQPELDFAEESFSDEAFRETQGESDDFQTAFASAEQEKAPYTPSGKVRPTRKGRPKRKKGYGLLGIPHLLATGVWLACILVIGITLGRFIWVCAADVLAFGRESNKVSVTITANDSIQDIAQKLHEAGLVRYPQLFELYAGIAVDEGDIIPGTFEMDTLYDYHALVIQMGPRSSNRAVVEDVLIPEGYNCRQIFQLLEERGICTVAELEEYAANGEFADFWFLEGVERGDKYCLEGFLFPDTYDFYAHSTPREALGKMLLGFEKRFTQEIYAQLPALNERLSAMMRRNGCSEEHIAANQLDLRDLLTVASLIEEETASVKENPTIASVIYNRLTQDQEYERYLGIDATILYALGEHTDSLTQEDLSIDSPYNTRTHAGLVPGPITNPGLDSINAALNPADTAYYYYVLNPETYLHDFSKTLEEHEKKVEKYRAITAGGQE